MVEVVKKNGIHIQEADRVIRDTDFVYDLYEDREKLDALVTEQLQHHFDKRGVQRCDDGNWVKIIVEELGEMVQELNKQNWEEFEHEMAQTIACLIRLYNEGNRMRLGIAKDERLWYVRAD